VAGWTEKSVLCTDVPAEELEVLPVDGTLMPPIDALCAVAAAIVAK
jgi:hypothetical protein